MKKLFYGLGAVAAVVTPVVAVVSCGSSSESKQKVAADNSITINFTGAATTAALTAELNKYDEQDLFDNLDKVVLTSGTVKLEVAIEAADFEDKTTGAAIPTVKAIIAKIKATADAAADKTFANCFELAK